MKVGFIKNFKRTKTTPDIFGAECYLHGKTKQYLYKNTVNKNNNFITNCSANKRRIFFTGEGLKRQKICIKNAT